ncbi:phytanoyl-CoA dioxygenase family protein [Leptospira yasudae]|uniref:Phytanoyl-CoA dioxygenase n=1 Tax=Leptospira yasudae TaxID=2202201 RepID=A0A6N4R1Z6_9LEPT|nr:phytanoyl-CoA dioxygenase family protein [Leptospira yasudae]TGL77740.1 phytanoyl-CoA dioxygenase [Leptospira yasudae]TGL81146.1 phytanoyl-CoA dioxygenase [Leptospira yasudae]TGL82569.1 phytanoyl-CoA dioxygenase [Leptospira yasudae]
MYFAKRMIFFFLRKIKIEAVDIKDLRNVLIGFKVVKKENYTPPESFQSMINLFCRTKGKSNQYLHKIISFFNPKVKLDNYSGILKLNSKKDIRNIVDQIRNKGYYVVENALPSDIVEYLHSYGTNMNCRSRPLHSSESSNALDGKIDFNNLTGIHYDFNEENLINDSIVQNLMTDRSLIAVAQEYLGCMPRSNVTAMWWHTNFEKAPNAEAATMWHFDMDHVRWLKFFFYITDVDSESGPHSFVEGTHKPGSIPDKLLQRGYARILDEEIEETYPREKIIEFVGPKGTLIIEDTIGLHKGKHVVNGARLLFQMTYSDHMFGGSYSKRKFHTFKDKATEQFIMKNKEIYKKYIA